MNTLATIRAGLAMTQAELATALGMTQGNVSHYECGKVALPLKRAKRLREVAASRGYSLTLGQICGDEPLPPGMPQQPAQQAG